MSALWLHVFGISRCTTGMNPEMAGMPPQRPVSLCRLVEKTRPKMDDPIEVPPSPHCISVCSVSQGRLPVNGGRVR